MALDGVVINKVVQELQVLVNGKVNKIFEPNRNEIYLSIYNGGKNYLLDISCNSENYRINLSTTQKPNPKNVFNFCMVLRKHLTGGTIKSISMNHLERRVFIEFECYNELNDLVTKKLIVELMGKHSNIILVDSNDTIIDGICRLSTIENSTRDIFPGSKYVAIDNNKKDYMLLDSFEAFQNDLLAKKDELESNSISQTMSTTYNGFGKRNLFFLFSELSIDDSNFSTDNLNHIYNTINTIISSPLKSKCTLKLLSEEKQKYDYYITLDTSEDSEEYLQANFFLDDFYTGKEEKESYINYRNNVLRYLLLLLKRLNNKLVTIDDKIKECDDMEKYKLYGELITSNLYKLPDYNIEDVTLENYYDNNNPINIKLDSSISPSQNAKVFFKKYKKLQNTVGIIQNQKELINTQIAYLTNILESIEKANNKDEVKELYDTIVKDLSLSDAPDFGINGENNNKNHKPKNEISGLPTSYVIDGFTILVGKNNKQNDMLTCKIAKPNDLWFHTQDIHGSHVVLRLEKSIDKYDQSKIDSIIYRCATIAAYFSKARMSSNVPVDYTYIKYVKKPNGAKPGMVIFTNNRTLFVNPKEP